MKIFLNFDKISVTKPIKFPNNLTEVFVVPGPVILKKYITENKRKRFFSSMSYTTLHNKNKFHNFREKVYFQNNLFLFA